MAAKQISIIEDPALIGPISVIEDPSIIRPMMTYIATASCSLYIDSNGNATVDSFIYGYPDTVERVTISSYLQQNRNGIWVTIKSWQTADNLNFVSLYKTTPIESGYTYRAKAIVRAFSTSGGVETREIYTSEATY